MLVDGYSRGSISATVTAVNDAPVADTNSGKVIAAHVIARPHDELVALLPK